jgi:hypothetical protein
LPIAIARCGVTRRRDPVEAQRPATRRRDQEAQRSRAAAQPAAGVHRSSAGAA